MEDIEPLDNDYTEFFDKGPSFESATGIVRFNNKRYTPHSLCGSNLGSHKLFHCRCCVAKGTGSDFANYGLGIVLWFKYVKMMFVVFFGLTILAMPQYVLFGSSGKLLGELESESKLHVLGQLGMANMGEGNTLCVTAQENSVLALQCSESQTLSIKEVTYGHPTGLCSCPGTEQFAKQFNAMLPPNPTFPLSCSNSQYPYSGVEKYSQSRCCSQSLLPTGEADLTSLLFKDQEFCYSKSSATTASTTATATTPSSKGGDDCSNLDTGADTKGSSYAFDVVEAGCVGKNGCKIQVDDRTTYNGSHFKYCSEQWYDVCGCVFLMYFTYCIRFF